MRQSSTLVAWIAGALAVGSCSDQFRVERDWVKQTVEHVRGGNPVPRWGQGGGSGALEAEMQQAITAIRASTGIEMEEFVSGANRLSCAHGKLLGVPGTPRLAVLFSRMQQPWLVWQLSIRRNCSCYGRGTSAKCSMIGEVAAPITPPKP